MSKKSSSIHNPGEWFAAARAAELSGLSVAMVNYLCRIGVVEPTCACQRGHGRARHYSFGDIVALRVVDRLSKSGVQPLRLKKAMRGMRKFHPEITAKSLPASHFVTNGRDVYLHRNGESPERVFDGQFAFAFVIELYPIQRDVVQLLNKNNKTPKRKTA